ncbi:hypothetical protein CASFOL_005689 [Castilleja foliolosa]|uniref:Cytochrome P450 n=1 Tax=Castilleja foliolosa TaxID=1961234 RepID=A0ABD3E878_9LAMI
MDFLSFILAIALLLLFTSYYFKNPRTLSVPEPPGAWPVIGHLHLLGGQAPVARTLGLMADKHDPIFTLRLGSHRALVVSNWEVIKECFTTNDRVFATRPSMATGKYMGYENAAFALAPYGPYWREIRKMVTIELFITRRLNNLSHVLNMETEHLIKHLYKTEANRVLALSSWLEHLTFNTIIRMLAGKGYSYDSEGDGQFKEAVLGIFYSQ